MRPSPTRSASPDATESNPAFRVPTSDDGKVQAMLGSAPRQDSQQMGTGTTCGYPLAGWSSSTASGWVDEGQLAWVLALEHGSTMSVSSVAIDWLADLAVDNHRDTTERRDTLGPPQTSGVGTVSRRVPWSVHDTPKRPNCLTVDQSDDTGCHEPRQAEHTRSNADLPWRQCLGLPSSSVGHLCSRP